MGFKSIGHFVIMIYEIIMDDVRPFLSILGIFVVAFSTAIYVVLQPTSARSVRDFSGQLVTCFEWLTNGGYEGGVVAAAERGKVLMGFLMAAFTILGAVVLLNLLVAMMGDTYAKVSENAVAKWRLERARIMLRLERHIPDPPPRPSRPRRLDRPRRRPLPSGPARRRLDLLRAARRPRLIPRATFNDDARAATCRRAEVPTSRRLRTPSFRDATTASRDRVDARDARARERATRNERTNARARGRGRAAGAGATTR